MRGAREEFCCWYGAYKGWRCSRTSGHAGACALRPKWWNLLDRWRFRGMN